MQMPNISKTYYEVDGKFFIFRHVFFFMLFMRVRVVLSGYPGIRVLLRQVLMACLYVLHDYIYIEIKMHSFRR